MGRVFFLAAELADVFSLGGAGAAVTAGLLAAPLAVRPTHGRPETGVTGIWPSHWLSDVD